MKVIQILHSLIYGDGVANCVLSISKILDELNFANNICALFVDERIKDKHIEKYDIYEPIAAGDEDIIIYHLYDGNPLNYIVENLYYRKILVFHNVTTPDFFRGIDDNVLKSCLWGAYDAAKTVGKYNKGIALSEFSKRNLIEMGWKSGDVSVIPLIKTNNIDDRPNSLIVNKYSNDYINILFTGRMVPHKKIEDIIRIFIYYQKYVNRKSRLILVGGISQTNYYEALLDYIYLLNGKNIIFTGHITNEDLEAYYAVSNIFLCMSEHEGFCIPLVEAMKREIPIIAYSSTAVPDTLGEAGVLVDEKDEKVLADKINKLAFDAEYRKKIIDIQNKRLESLSLENYKIELKNLICEVSRSKSGSYQTEQKRMRVSYPAKMNIGKDFVELCLRCEQIVIYGIGKIGIGLLNEVEKNECEVLKKIVLCDNGFQRDDYKQIPVLNHKECVTKYPHAMYIVTVQNAFVDIIADLINDNIRKENIKYYNAYTNKLV